MRNRLGVTALAIVLAVAGCGTGTASQSPSQAPTGTTAPSSQPSTSASTSAGPSASASFSAGTDDGTRISVWTRASTQSQAQQLVAAYNATHKNQVDMQIVPNDNMQTKVGAAAGAGSLPDIISGDVVFMPNWASQD